MTKILDLKPKLQTLKERTKYILEQLAIDVQETQKEMKYPVGYFLMLVDVKGCTTASYDMALVPASDDYDTTEEYLKHIFTAEWGKDVLTDIKDEKEKADFLDVMKVVAQAIKELEDEE